MLFGDNTTGLILLLIFLIIFPMVMNQMLLRNVSRYVEEMEKKVEEAEKLIIKMCKRKHSKELKKFLEFFVAKPSRLDPHGIVKRFEKILNMSEKRFKEVADKVLEDLDEEKKSNFIMALKSTLSLKSTAKIIRHNLELAKKTKNFQILIALQMNLNLIRRFFEAQFEGVKAFSKGLPVGDSAGVVVAGALMDGNDDLKEMGDMVYTKKSIDGRNVIIVRSKGPGARIGRVGRVVTRLIDKNNIDHLIMIDAAVKLEGEKTGSVAEGVGVVVGGTGVEKWLIENKITEKDIDVSSVIIKMSLEEAVSQMNKKILEGCKKAIKIVNKMIERYEKDSNILVVGVGNSSGIPNVVEDLSKIKIKEEVKNGNTK